MKKFNLFHGLNINPIPLEFSNSLTTTEFLLAIQKKVNELLDYLTTFENNMNNNVEELEKEVNQYTDEKITEVNNTINEVKESIAENESFVKEEVTEQIAVLREQLEVELQEISDFLHLISNGESVDISGVVNHINDLNSQVDDLKNNLAYVRYKDFNLFEVDEDSLEAKIKSFTYGIEEIDIKIQALYGAVTLAKQELNESINSAIQSMTNDDEKIEERVDATIKMIIDINKATNERYSNIVERIGNVEKATNETFNRVDGKINYNSMVILDYVEAIANALTSDKVGVIPSRPML